MLALQGTNGPPDYNKSYVKSTVARRTTTWLHRFWSPIRRPVVIIVKPVLVLASDGHRLEALRGVLDGFPDAALGLGMCQPPFEAIIASASFGPQLPRL